MAKRIKKNSIYVKFMFPLMVIVFILNVTVFSVLYGLSGTKLKENAVEIFDNQVEARKNSFESQMLKNWANLTLDVEVFSEIAENTALKHNMSVAEALENAERNDITAVIDMLGACSEDLLLLLRRNNVNDVFLVLDTDLRDAEYNSKKYGIYLRDRNPMEIESNADITVEVAPKNVAYDIMLAKLGFDVATEYETLFDFSSETATQSGKHEFFDNPKFIAENYKNIPVKYSGYWCSDFLLHKGWSDISRAITYSVPLIDRNGNFFGVLGVGIMIDYIQQYLLPLTDFASEYGNYALLKTSADDAKGVPVASNFSDMTRSEYDGANKSYDRANNSYSLNIGKDKYHVSYVPLNLYANNTPFVDEIWVLAGMVREDGIYAFTDNFTTLVLSLAVAMFVLSFAVFIWFSFMLSRPVSRLTEKVEKQKSGKLAEIEFDKTHIYEIDTLVAGIDSLVQKILEEPKKLTRILNMSNLPIAAFEYDEQRNYFYATDGLAELIGMSPTSELSGEDFSRRMRDLTGALIERNTSGNVKRTVYDLAQKGESKFIELSVVKTDEGYSGVVRDVTKEFLEKRTLEYERDMDTLTPLCNRKGYERKVHELFGKTSGCSAILMIDIDRLKYYNDRYGHEVGDRVIILVGMALFGHCDVNCVGAHLSGDEYILMFHGIESEERLRALIESVRKDMEHLHLDLSATEKLKISVSGGYVICQRTDNYNLMQNHADFALYESKKSRGSFVEFSEQQYASDKDIQRNKEALENFLNKKQADFHYQPVVDLHSGEVFGYEAFMRPKGENLDTPLAVLALAKEYGRLYDVEKMTYFEAAGKFIERGGATNLARLFINSIPTELLSDNDLKLFERQYKPLLPRIVTEFTELEFMNDEIHRSRSELLKEWGAGGALDDYGMGYGNFSAIANKSLSYVKMDRLLIQDAHLHPRKRESVSKIVKFCHSENIKVVAEGIESREELETMMRLGVDFAQGYFLAKPSAELTETNETAKSVITEYRAAHKAAQPRSKQ